MGFRDQVVAWVIHSLRDGRALAPLNVAAPDASHHFTVSVLFCPDACPVAGNHATSSVSVYRLFGCPSTFISMALYRLGFLDFIIFANVIHCYNTHSIRFLVYNIFTIGHSLSNTYKC